MSMAASARPVAGPGLREKTAASLINSFRLSAAMQRLRYYIQAGTKTDTKEFQICCISFAKCIDFAIANSDIPKKVEEFHGLLKQVCRYGAADGYTKTGVMVLMISVKHACQLGWFSDNERQELIALADEIRTSFGSSGSTCPGITSPGSSFSQIMERFYPFLKLGHVLVSLEVKAGYTMLAHDFHIAQNMPHSVQEKIRLFVAQTDNIDTSACISNPPEVSFLLNGKGVEKRVNIPMDSGPQLPTKYETNLLQVMGNFKGNYAIIIAFTGVVVPPEKPILKDYLQSGVVESSPDSDIIEGPSRVSFNCPISRRRIKLPVKGQMCKHLQCFDFSNYVHINMRNPSWRCPHCNQPVCYPDIRLDQNMAKILKDVEHNAADVIIDAGGTWKVSKKTDETEETVHEIIHDLEDPMSLLKSGPVVLDLTGDDDVEMEVFGDNKIRTSFGSSGSTSPGITSPGSSFSQIMERFYPFLKLGHVLVSFKVKAGYTMLAHDFHIAQNMPHSVQEKIGLFVAQIDNINTSACISNPPEVNFLLNGKGVEKRVNITMDSGPQLPTNVTTQLKYGTNLLQVMGNFKGNYAIIIAFTGVVVPAENPILKDYLQSAVVESSPDSDIIEGPSRVSLNCPISLKRIKLPVKGQLCKHLQCFDFSNYVHINMRNPFWRCPHCNQPVCYPDICLDQKMAKILKDVGHNAADVIIDAGGTWKVAKKTDETEEPVREIIHDLEEPMSLLNSGPVVLDLTVDDNAEMEVFGDNKVEDRKPCLSDAQGQSNNNNTKKDASNDDYCSVFDISDVIALDPEILAALENTGTCQQYPNLSQIPMSRDPMPVHVPFSQAPSPRETSNCFQCLHHAESVAAILPGSCFTCYAHWNISW